MRYLLSTLFVLSFGVSSFASENIQNVIGEKNDQAVAPVLDFGFNFLAKAKSEVLTSDSEFAYCYISRPGERDRTGRYCNGTYGVIYDGYIVNNACWNNVNDAANSARSLRVCSYSPPARHGYCELISPNLLDNSRRRCENTHAYTYNGYIVNNSCFQNVDAALQDMQYNQACQRFTRSGQCEVLQPTQRDYSGRYCEQGYGVAYRGQIMNNTCYNRLQEAIATMERSSACY